MFPKHAKRSSPPDMSYGGAGVDLPELLALAWRQRRQNGMQPRRVLCIGHLNISSVAAARAFLWGSAKGTSKQKEVSTTKESWPGADVS